MEQIKQWEVGFLGLLGGNEETSKMQDRLGIEIIADEESSGDILTRRWKVIQQRSDLPKWTGKDAVKVCSFYCLYRLLDACAFTDGIPASVPNRPRRKLRIKISSKQSEVCTTTIGRRLEHDTNVLSGLKGLRIGLSCSSTSNLIWR